MATEVSICSNALLMLGADPISSFDEADNTGSNIERARLASNLLADRAPRDPARSYLEHGAQARPALARHHGAGVRLHLSIPEAGRLAAHRRRRRRTRCFDFASEGNYLLCDLDALPLVYVYDNVNPVTYDASLVLAFEIAMAARMAYPVTKSTSLAAELGAAAQVEQLQDGARARRARRSAANPGRRAAAPRPLLGGRCRVPKTVNNQTNFTAGELTPRMMGRGDVARYQNGAEIIENALVLVHGGLERRDGQRYLATTQFGADAHEPHDSVRVQRGTVLCPGVRRTAMCACSKPAPAR